MAMGAPCVQLETRALLYVLLEKHEYRMPPAQRTIGLGCMRLSTARDRDDERALQVIRAALDAGATFLDTADAYCHDEHDVGHNERLIARALDRWGGSGDRARVTVATKGGMRRPGGAWVPDGKAKHLREACDASRDALGVETIDLYQLHAVDPRTPLETSVRALARLREEGRIREIGLCNVTVSQIRAAQTIAPIACVQVSISPFDDENLRNGVAEYCRDNGIRLVAYRPLGGERVRRLAKDAVVSRIAAKWNASLAQVALAWLLSFGPNVVPIPGATRMDSATELAGALALELDADDRSQLDDRFAGRLLRLRRDERRPHATAGERAEAPGEVVLVMGMPGAGKSSVARTLEKDGYDRLNRDEAGGTLGDLIPLLHELLGADRHRVVLDNTYPTRKARNEVIEAAWEHRLPVRCVWLDTDVADAQINCICRMIAVHGSLPMPEDIRELGKRDTRFLLPDAQFRYERTLEPPTTDEGFESVEMRPFVRERAPGDVPALMLDLDDLVGNRTPVLEARDVNITPDGRTMLERRAAEGFRLFVHAWRPQIARRATTLADVYACFARLREIVGTEIDSACCPHDAGPPICWCRKPIPGSVIEFAMRRNVALDRSVVRGSSAADRTMAARIGARFESSGPAGGPLDLDRRGYE
jgi:aryl-alcohol dehydrogenase-like predicted oxidoreductase/histidinol phosphatase-like enzyme